MYEIYKCYRGNCKEGTTLNEHLINFLSPILVDFFIFTLLLGILVYFYNKSKRNRVDKLIRSRAVVLLDRYLCSVISNDQVLLDTKKLKSGKESLTVAFGGVNVESRLLLLENDSALLSNRLQSNLRDITLMFGASGSEKMSDILFKIDSLVEKINRIHPKDGVAQSSEIHENLVSHLLELMKIRSAIISKL